MPRILHSAIVSYLETRRNSPLAASRLVAGYVPIKRHRSFKQFGATRRLLARIIDPQHPTEVVQLDLARNPKVDDVLDGLTDIEPEFGT